jgi:uncharacterized phage protein (TIGR02218 family)
MRNIPAALQTELSSVTPRIARLVKITLKNNTIYSFTDHNENLIVGGITYVPAPGLTAFKFNATSDTQVSNQQLGTAWVTVPDEDLLGGRFDNARVEAFWCSWADVSAGTVKTFDGRIGELTWADEGFTADIMSFMKNLEKNIGYNYTPTCRHQLFSSVGPGKVGACQLSSAAYTFAGAIATVTIPKWKFVISGAAAGKADGYYSNGVITFTSGLNTGLSATVKKQVGNNIELFLPTAFVADVGATFTIQAGCDKTLDTCRDKFNNIPNFGGFPHINTDVTFR